MRNYRRRGSQAQQFTARSGRFAAVGFRSAAFLPAAMARGACSGFGGRNAGRYLREEGG